LHLADILHGGDFP